MKLPSLPFLSFIAVFAFAGLSCDRHSFEDTASFFNEEGHGAHEGDSHAKEGKHHKEGEHGKKGEHPKGGDHSKDGEHAKGDKKH